MTERELRLMNARLQISGVHTWLDMYELAVMERNTCEAGSPHSTTAG